MSDKKKSLTVFKTDRHEDLAAIFASALVVVFVLTFLLAAMGAVAMLHTWRNLAHLKLRPGRCDPVFAGDTAQFRKVVLVEFPGPRGSRLRLVVIQDDRSVLRPDVGALPVYRRRVVRQEEPHPGALHSNRRQLLWRLPG